MSSARVSLTTKFSGAWLFLILVWVVFSKHPEMNLDHLLESPALSRSQLGPFLIGGDAFGRDLIPTLGEAMRRSLLFAVAACSTASVLGVSIGAVIGMSRSRFGFWMERGLDFFLAFPAMLLALAVQAALGTGWRSLGFAVTAGLTPLVVRFISSRAKEISVTDFIEAARALGGNRTSLLWRHYRPALWAHLRLKLPSLFAQALLLEATLSFLNLGVPPGTLSWGSLLIQGKDYLIEAPHIAWCVGVPLVFTLLSLQSLGDRSETPESET